MIELFRQRRPSIPRDDSLLIHIPLISSLNPRTNNTTGEISSTGVIKTPEGYHFTGKSHILLPSDVGITGDYTMGGWFKRVGRSPYDELHIMFGGRPFEISIGDPGYVRCGLHVNGRRYVANRGTGVIVGDSWYHVAYTYKHGVGVTPYINGIPYELIPTTTTGSLPTTTPRRIGSFPSDSYGSNAIYRGMTIHNVALTTDEVKQLMSRSFVTDI